MRRERRSSRKPPKKTATAAACAAVRPTGTPVQHLTATGRQAPHRSTARTGNGRRRQRLKGRKPPPTKDGYGKAPSSPSACSSTPSQPPSSGRSSGSPPKTGAHCAQGQGKPPASAL